MELGEIFKAYDVRGKVGTELTPKIVEAIGRAVADWLPEPGTVAVGRDMRPDSEELAAALIDGLRLQGRNVLDIGLVTTDMMYFAVGNFGLAGGAMVTASHNPGEYNGIKLCREAAKPVGIESGLADIREVVGRNDFVSSTAEGAVELRDITAEWITHVLGFVDTTKWPAYRVAIDAGNGMAGKVLSRLASALPLQITPLYFELDGTFPNHVANPMQEETLKDLQEEIRRNKLDFGIAFDADGDRMRMLDENSKPLSGTVLTAILAKYFLQREPDAVILYNAICGRIVPEMVEAAGGTAVRTRVGHSYIKEDMAEEGAVFAGEHSCHYFFRDNFNADSGLIAAMLAIEVLSRSGKKLSELAAEYDPYFSIPEQNFTVKDKQAVIERLAAAFTDGEHDDLDGLTVSYDDAWFNVRPSNTEPLLRLNAEAESQKRLDELVAKVQAVLAEE